MTYYGSKELAAAFRTVRDNTIKIAEEIPENEYDFRPRPILRTVRDTLAHIAVSTGFQSHVHGNRITDMSTLNFQELFQKFSAEETKPRTKAEVDRLPEGGRRQVREVPRGRSESQLAEQVTMRPGRSRRRRAASRCCSRRRSTRCTTAAQLMTYQRLIGQVPHLTRQMQERMAAMTAAQQAQP